MEIPPELADIETMVCLTHGSFVPCRKPGDHHLSNRPEDIRLVRYHQEVSVRLQNIQYPQPEYEEVRLDPQDCQVVFHDEYDSYYLGCGENILETRHNNSYLKRCLATFSGCTLREITASAVVHYSSTVHYRMATPNRKEGNAKH